MVDVAALAGRFMRRHAPTRDEVLDSPLLKPFGQRIRESDLWRFTRRSVPRGVAIGLFVGIFLMVPGLQIIGAALVSAPLVLWDWRAFVHSAGTVQKLAPFRTDALSYLAFIYHHLNPTLAPKLSWLSFAILPFAIALGLWKSPRTPSGFALALSVLFFLFLVFSKQAFANYYFFLLGALCWAIAIADDLPRRHEDTKALPSNESGSIVTT